MRIRKVTSGGQDGVDVAALRAAKRCGILTGGAMPKGFRTKSGPRPEYRDLYGMEEHPSTNYPPRTWRNVENSDATLRLATRFNSPGEICTLKAILALKKPYLDVSLPPRQAAGTVIDWVHTLCGSYFPTALTTLKTLDSTGILNVAGNSDSCLESVVEDFLYEVFTILKE
jgi:hypothetical protein